MAVCGGRGVRTRGVLPTLGGGCAYHTGPWADLPARNLPSLEWQVWDTARASQLTGLCSRVQALEEEAWELLVG